MMYSRLLCGWSGVAAATLSLVASVPLRAAEPEPPTRSSTVTTDEAGTAAKQANAKQAEGQRWTSLFDGKTLTGWEQKNGLATYEVVDGTIVGSTVANSPNSFLCTVKDYSDFELEFDIQLKRDNLNSGVQIRSRSTADYQNRRVHGPQVEIEAAPGEAGYIYGEATGRGWLSQDRSQHQDAFHNGEWNHYRVMATGPRIQTWINGTPVADLTDEDSYRSGFIALQVHGYKGPHPGQVAWKNIRIRELGSSAHAESTVTPVAK